MDMLGARLIHGDLKGGRMSEDIKVERQDGWIEVTIHRPDS